MTHVEIGRNELSDPALARQFEDEIAEAVDVADAPDGLLACTILDEGLHAEIEMEAPGWTERVPVPYPARPGDVKRAVENVLRQIGFLLDR